MILVGQTFKFDTMMILDHLPGILPVSIKLKVIEVDYQNAKIVFEPGPYDTEYVDENLLRIFRWFREELHKMGSDKSILCHPVEFERFIQSGSAQLLQKELV